MYGCAESMAVYRKVPGSITNSGYAARVRFLRSQVEIIEDACDRFGVNDADRVSSLAGIHRVLASASLFANDETEFERAFTWLKANAPEFATSWRGRMLAAVSKAPIGRAMARFIHSWRVRIREATDYR